jgi:hypothetical protein
LSKKQTGATVKVFGVRFQLAVNGTSMVAPRFARAQNEKEGGEQKKVF